jgi:hypothetical protein
VKVTLYGVFCPIFVDGFADFVIVNAGGGGVGAGVMLNPSLKKRAPHAVER